MLAIVSADEDPVVRSDASPDDRQPGFLVPNDKHVGLRNLHVITASAPFGSEPLTAWAELYNPFPYPQFFDIHVDRAALPRNVKLAVVLPKTTSRPPLGEVELPGVRIGSAKQRGWWAGALRRSGKRDAAYSAEITHPASGREGKTGTIPSVLIPPDRPLRFGVIVQVPKGTPAGASLRFSVVQRARDAIVGGSTYEVRVAPQVAQETREGQVARATREGTKRASATRTKRLRVTGR
jgi:hypothetical protein